MTEKAVSSDRTPVGFAQQVTVANKSGLAHEIKLSTPNPLLNPRTSGDKPGFVRLRERFSNGRYSQFQ